MRGTAKFILAMGVIMTGLSALLMPYQAEGSPERVISWVNLGIGALMVISGGVYLGRAGNKSGNNPKENNQDDKKRRNL